MNRMEIDPTLREELLQMVATDQDARQRLLSSPIVQQRLSDPAFAELGGARHQLIGMPSGPQSRYSLKPQYQRLWARH